MGRGSPGYNPVDIARSVANQAGFNRSHREAINDVCDLALIKYERADVMNELKAIRALLEKKGMEIEPQHTTMPASTKRS